ncbi:MAG: hypothetical protein ACREBW_05775 [Candidatus Micrarchaeaceae archaeon]
MSFWTDLEKDAVQVIRTVAPTLAATAAGPFAPLVLPLIDKVFGTTDASAVNTALASATPAQLTALKQADVQLQEQLAQLGVQKDQLAYQDTASARAMQIATKDSTPGRLAWMLVGGFLAIVIGECLTMTVWPKQWVLIPSDAAALMGTLLGYLANEAKQVAAFYFGSSADSQAKTQTLSEIAKS